MNKYLNLFILFILIGFQKVSLATSIEDSFLLDSTRKTTWTADIVQVKGQSLSIPNLEIINSKVPVYLVNKENIFKPLIAIELRINSPNSEIVNIENTKLETKTNTLEKKPENIKMDAQFLDSLFLATNPEDQNNSEYIKLEKDPKNGRYKIFTYLKQKKNELTLYYIDKNNKKYIETIFITSPDAQEYEVIQPWEFLRIGIGNSLFNYNQTHYQKFYAWLGQLNLKYVKEKVILNYGINAEADLGLFAFNTNQKNVSMQSLALKFDLTDIYNLKSFYGFNSNLSFGMTYLNTFVTGENFGLTNTYFPNIGIIAHKILNNKSDIEFNARFGLLDINFDSLGIELELSRSHLFATAQRGELGIKFQDYILKPNNENYSAELQVISIFLRYGL